MTYAHLATGDVVAMTHPTRPRAHSTWSPVIGQRRFLAVSSVVPLLALVNVGGGS